MQTLLGACAEIFDKSPQPFGIARVFVNSDGEPLDFTYAYLNPAMAAMTGQTVEELQGRGAYAMWGGDRTWLEHFYEAAYHNTGSEFELVSDMLEQFLDVVAFPIMPEYCGFLLQDVTSFMGRAHHSLQNVTAGMVFFDYHLQVVMLTQTAREICGLGRGYLEVSDLVDTLFKGEQATSALDQLRNFSDPSSNILEETQLEDGRWVRLSLSHTGRTDRFGYGFIEDITRTKRAENISARRMNIIDSLSQENYALYLADLDKDIAVAYRVYNPLSAQISGAGTEGMSYDEFISQYAKSYVVEEDRERFLAEMDRERMIRRFSSSPKEFSISFHRRFEHNNQYVELRVFRSPEPGNHIVLAARNVNDQMLEQLRQRDALQAALNMAEQASSAKSTFLTNMSHDFRTPLNSITGFATIALDHIDDTERVHDCLQKIRLSSEHLGNLVNDILDVSRIESGKVALNEEYTDLHALANEAQRLYSPEAVLRGLDFRVDSSAVVHNGVICDKLRVNQILSNTIGNALKFTQSGGHVRVTFSEIASTANYCLYRIVVEDDGCGMTPEFRAKIFKPFERDATSQVGHTEGTGLGMTITNNLVKLMGGTIDVESELGVGSRFTITLPLQRASSDIAPAEAAEAKEAAADQTTKSSVRYDGKRALVVDDDDLSREITISVLSERGIISEEADDGDTAVQMVKDSALNYYDIILMDMRMPRMSGDDATREIRALDREDTKTMPVVATTADAYEEGFRCSREAGVDAYLTKPLNMRELSDVLDKYLGGKE